MRRQESANCKRGGGGSTGSPKVNKVAFKHNASFCRKSLKRLLTDYPVVDSMALEELLDGVYKLGLLPPSVQAF